MEILPYENSVVLLPLNQSTLLTDAFLLASYDQRSRGHPSSTCLSYTANITQSHNAPSRETHTHSYGHILKCVLCFRGGMVPHWGGGACSPVWSDAHHKHMGVVQSRCRIHHPAGSRNILLAEFVLAGVFTQSCVFWNSISKHSKLCYIC